MFDDENAQFDVVMNEEEQYSIWPCERALPSGWSKTGQSGDKQSCLQHIESVWVDMRPLSLRRWMEEKSTTA